MLSSATSATVIRENDTLYAVCIEDGDKLVRVRKDGRDRSYRCPSCGSEGPLPEAIWTPPALVSTEVPVSSYDHILIGWVASWLGIQQWEVKVERSDD